MQFLSFNEIVILGKVGNSPAFEKNAEGVPYASFQVATEQVVSGQAGEKKTKTLWHQIVACGNLAELANDYLYRGVRVL